MRWVRLNLNELVVREDLGKQLSNFRNRPMVLLTLDITAFMCLSNVKGMSNIRPKPFCDEICWASLSKEVYRTSYLEHP